MAIAHTMTVCKSAAAGTVIGSNDVVDISSGDDLHIGGSDASQNGVYVVINGDQRVTLANNNGYLGNTQIASGTLEVSDNSQGTQAQPFSDLHRSPTTQ